jgi:hypothetical protein
VEEFSTFPIPWKKKMTWYMRYNIPLSKRPWKTRGKPSSTAFRFKKTVQLRLALVGCVFQRKRTPVPIQSGHSFQLISDSCRSEATLWG